MPKRGREQSEAWRLQGGGRGKSREGQEAQSSHPGCSVSTLPRVRAGVSCLWPCQRPVTANQQGRGPPGGQAGPGTGPLAARQTNKHLLCDSDALGKGEPPAWLAWGQHRNRTRPWEGAAEGPGDRECLCTLHRPALHRDELSFHLHSTLARQVLWSSPPFYR